MSDGPNRDPGPKTGRRARYHQTDEESAEHERGDTRRDPQERHTDEQEPIRQQNRYDPGRRRPL